MGILVPATGAAAVVTRVASSSDGFRSDGTFLFTAPPRVVGTSRAVYSAGVERPLEIFAVAMSCVLLASCKSERKPPPAPYDGQSAPQPLRVASPLQGIPWARRPFLTDSNGQAWKGHRELVEALVKRLA